MATPIIPTNLRCYFESVYEPAEDSFLMLDALESEMDFIKIIKPAICLEVGSGSGIVISFLAMQLGSNAFYMCTDINKLAVEASLILSRTNKVSVEPVLMDLVTAFDPQFYNKVDVLVFNPPYVQTPNNEVGGTQLSASWAGGEKGRIVMDRLFPHINHLLSPKGRFYLLTLDVNDDSDIEDIMLQMKFQKRRVISRKCGREKLSVTCFTRFTNN